MAASRGALAAAAVVVLGLPSAGASSVYVAKLCRGGFCADPAFPILDFDEGEQTCICRAHPCWSDKGVTHSCPTDHHPFLHFNYDENQTLGCGCSSIPQYDSLHIAKQKCPGHWCDNGNFSILDWSGEEQKCFCRSHPCLAADGQPHECPDPEKPILHYRLEVGVSGWDEPRCECVAKLEAPPPRSLRGMAGEPAPKLCSWSPKSSSRSS
eukprot:TRINITY_DN13374_c0_g1_i1.p1 TRINITY_DN13374_c0_g1~~TRINITY_DN13374_c0_g1_i1.p1  ORF type:complete len:219 (-),score=34.90 TRINITY_DN13374_c0_g1_i1:165-794(-)